METFKICKILQSAAVGTSILNPKISMDPVLRQVSGAPYLVEESVTLVIRSTFCLEIFVKSVLAGGLFTVPQIVSLDSY